MRPSASILYRHALRNALIPFVTNVGITTGYLLGGAIVVEAGLRHSGALAADPRRHNRTQLSAGAGDHPHGHDSASSLVNFVVDLIYGFIDPRVRR